jgi:hypothetical protein
MNFNLISGETNGYDYTVRFREDVVIEKNSKAYLNFACLSRIGKVVLDSDNTLTLTTTNMLPPVLPSDQTTSTNFTYTGTIPRGIYTYGDLQEKIKDFLNDCRGSALPQAGNKLYYYTPNLVQFRPETENDIVLGYFLDNGTRWINKNASLDGVNVKAMAPVGLDVAVKTSGTAINPIYDAYALSSTHYYHYAYKCDGQSQNSNLIHVKTNVDMSQQKGAIFCGLYSKEYAGTAGSNDANRTAGNVLNLTPIGSGTTKGQIPRCFMGVEITEARAGLGRSLRVWVGCRNTTAPLQTISDFTTINTPILSMKQVFKTSLVNVWAGLDNHAEFAIQTYYDTTNDNYQGNNKQLYFRVLKYEGQEQITGNMVLYDSQRDGIFFPYSFFRYTNPTSADQVNSSIPFNIIMCAQAQNEGFTDVVYKEFDKTTNNLNTNPKCIMENYSIAVSKELADYLQTENTGQLYPNVCEMRGSGFYYLTDMRLTWKKTNYTIEIENLPLKNFKNTAEGANGGFSQNILANIPAPFSNVIESNTPDDATVSSIFQPNFPIMTYMFNQPIRLNNFRVKIKNMADDKPAFELINSVVNFTVIPGTE